MTPSTKPEPDPQQQSSASGGELIERFAPLGLVLAVLFVGLLTLYPFLPAILWGIVLGIAVAPLHNRLLGRLGNRRALAAVLTGFGLVLCFVVPALGIATALASFLPSALNWVERVALAGLGKPPDPILKLPIVGESAAELWRSLGTDLSSLATHFGDEIKAILVWFAYESEILGIFVFEFAIGVILAALLVYNFDRVSELSHKFFDRLGGTFARRMAVLSVQTTRQTVIGVLGAALVQTLFATFSYVVAGVPGWIIWAGIVFVLSLIQVGPALVFIPMSIWFWAQGQPGMAIFIFLWGVVGVALVDYVVRPLLVSKGTHFPAILAFLGAMGGLIEWGLVGVFLGPVVVAVCYEMILKWIEPDTLPR
ncbi:AI-2E family transporter [Methyloceanibacter methanicus]|uniref:AI-2E family transporter n=1 Tax=Methyloceanibacter methanicus TaxID=1774968 RepID=UPI0009F4DF59|nr:AI-2E family transporter [Methyloceanibacter methanicus]